MSEPRAKRRALKAKKRALRRINERPSWQDEESDKQAESINKRLSTIEATMANMVVKFTNLEARAPSSNMKARFANIEKILTLIQKNGTTATTNQSTVMTRTPPTELIIWQWNMNGTHGKKAVLIQAIKHATRQPDIILLQETHCEVSPKIPRYRSYATSVPKSTEKWARSRGESVPW